jgi:methyl-accepting chemotaxis protein
MTDYPNMSYCMCNNTLAALNQIMDAMEDVDFVRNLNMDEMRAFNELVHVAKQFAQKGEQAIDAAIDENVETILGDK